MKITVKNHNGQGFCGNTYAFPAFLRQSDQTHTRYHVFGCFLLKTHARYPCVFENTSTNKEPKNVGNTKKHDKHTSGTHHVSSLLQGTETHVWKKHTRVSGSKHVIKQKHMRVSGSNHVLKQKHMRVMAFFLCFYENTSALTVFSLQTLTETTRYPKVSVITSQGVHRPGSQ